MLEKTELNNSQKRREQMRAAMKFMAERAKQVEVSLENSEILHILLFFRSTVSSINYIITSTLMERMFGSM